VTDVLVVDWLGRGGIAQASACWAAELTRAGRSVEVVTRGGRELASLVPDVTGAGEGLRHLAAHRSVARVAAEAIVARRPKTVVVQNYVLPLLERPVYQAARQVGARLVVVVHDHRLHTVLAGNRVGLRRNLRDADVVAAHSHFVASGLRRLWPGPVDVLPLHLVMYSDGVAERRPAATGQEHGAVHFGILKRKYKGTGVVLDLAATGVPGWRFTLVGAGVPAHVPGATTVPRFAAADELLALVADADVALLPYSMATQSGAVALAQAVGTVPVASAVGGIPEQIVDGETGRLVPAGSGPDVWRAVLEELAADPMGLAAMSMRARDHARDAHERFTSHVLDLAG
jgi:glycosyltransferase involved in cell wall biosynthesis